MKKNYYEILEVDPKASNEIIEKAYKILAKKYHPDLQNGSSSKEYEEKMKEINEAYSILSDDFKRNSYDEQLQSQTVPIEEYQKLIYENQILKDEIRKISNNPNNRRETTYNNIEQTAKDYRQKINRVVNQQQYTQGVRTRKNKLTIKQIKNIIIAVICIVLVILLISQIPPIKKFLVELYEENIIIKALVDTFRDTFKQGF